MTSVIDYNCNRADNDDSLIILKCHPDVSWALFGMSQVWSFVAWLFLYGVCLIMSKRWKERGVPSWVDYYVGSEMTPPVEFHYDVALRMVEIASSSFIVFTWIYKSYSIENVQYHLFAVEVVACAGCLLQLAFRMSRRRFSPTFMMTSQAILDCFTLTPLLLQKSNAVFGGTFVTISYLRIYIVLEAYDDMASAGFLEPFLSDMHVAVMRKFLEFVAVTFAIAGTFWILEGLGDLPFLYDTYIDAGMGEISFLQMCYFTFITMSTVGYGDYSPTTIPGRMFIFVAVLGGVTFFSVASSEIIELQRLESTGLGRYRPSAQRGQNGHILIVGGGVDSGSAPIIENFLQALCRDESTPDIVLMGTSPCSEEVFKVLKGLNDRGFCIKFYVGTSMLAEDLERVRADLATFSFVLCDFNSANPQVEDESNILRTGALHRFRPSLPYRLMLCQETELELASQVGLDSFGCFALSEIKADLLASSLRAPGISTLLVNLCLKNIPEPSPHASPISPWMREYIKGAELEVYGFQPKAEYHGKSFCELASIVAADNVVVIAMQVNGFIRINPTNSIIDEHSIVFAISADVSAVGIFSHNGDADPNLTQSSWPGIFASNRKKRQQGDQVDANVARSGAAAKLWTTWKNNIAKAKRKSNLAEPFHGFGPLPSMGRLTNVMNVAKRTVSQSKSNNVALNSMKSSVAAERLADVLATGEHIVLVAMCSGEDDGKQIMHQINTIVTIVRCTHKTPIVVVACEDAKLRDQSTAELEFDAGDESQLYLIEGDPKRLTTLVAAGVERCESFMTLAPNAPPNSSDSAKDGRPVEPTMMDRENLLECSLLEHQLKIWGRTDLAPLYDWFHLDSVKFMPPPPHPLNLEGGVESRLRSARYSILKPKESIGTPIDLFSNFATVAPAPEEYDLIDGLPNLLSGDIEMVHTDSRAQYRFAAGRVLPKPMISSLFSMAYYTPGVLELLEAFISPVKWEQPSVVWAFPVPKGFVGKPYCELAKHFFAEGVIPIGMLRGQTGPLPFVVAKLPLDITIVTDGDALYVLANLDWAEKHVGKLFPSAATVNSADQSTSSAAKVNSVEQSFPSAAEENGVDQTTPSAAKENLSSTDFWKGKTVLSPLEVLGPPTLLGSSME
mmetsp:Transcript_64790/g.130298  ORF Transcript_64790/g.130298 Transcript_64790/m.130298 type:complete len:1130 (+) Transcript_64790:166-3555(+)